MPNPFLLSDDCRKYKKWENTNITLILIEN